MLPKLTEQGFSAVQILWWISEVTSVLFFKDHSVFHYQVTKESSWPNDSSKMWFTIKYHLEKLENLTDFYLAKKVYIFSDIFNKWKKKWFTLNTFHDKF